MSDNYHPEGVWFHQVSTVGELRNSLLPFRDESPLAFSIRPKYILKNGQGYIGVTSQFSDNLHYVLIETLTRLDEPFYDKNKIADWIRGELKRLNQIEEREPIKVKP